MSRSKQRIKIEELAIRDKENVYDTNTGGIDQGKQTSSLEKWPQLRWTTREHRPSTRYPSSKYILIIDRGSLRASKKCSLTKTKTVG